MKHKLKTQVPHTNNNNQFVQAQGICVNILGNFNKSSHFPEFIRIHRQKVSCNTHMSPMICCAVGACLRRLRTTRSRRHQELSRRCRISRNHQDLDTLMYLDPCLQPSIHTLDRNRSNALMARTHVCTRFPTNQIWFPAQCCSRHEIA